MKKLKVLGSTQKAFLNLGSDLGFAPLALSSLQRGIS